MKKDERNNCNNEMSGYTKIKRLPTAKSRCRGTPHFSPPPQEPPEEEEQGEVISKAHVFFVKEEEEDGNKKEDSEVEMGRSRSTLASQSHRFTACVRNNPSSMVTKTSSMRKPPEGYWRIHDTRDPDDDADESTEHRQQQMKSSGKKRWKFLRACKSLFRF